MGQLSGVVIAAVDRNGPDFRKGFTVQRKVLLAVGVFALLTTSAFAASQEGSIELTSGGPIAFGPEGVLFVSDPMTASLYAVETDDQSGDPASVVYQVKDVRGKVAAMLGTESEDVSINDLAVNPLSGIAYLSVTRGSGADAAAVILRVTPDGNVSEMSLKNVKFTKTSLPNPPASAQRRRGGGNQRMDSVTDLAYVDGRVFVAGLSNEEFASKLRSLAYPFEKADAGTSVEIYHGAHGRFETRSPVRTFASYKINGDPHLVAAYTCTPLVKFPVTALKPGDKIMGTTIAELGNQNRPLDMFVYQKDGQDYILMANSSRGVMKIATEGIDSIEGIKSRVGRGETAGLPYETIEELKGVMQLDRLNADHAIALVQAEDGQESLETIELP